MINLSKAIDLESKDYRLVFKFDIKDLKPPPFKIIGNKSPRYCRFCRRYEGKTAFRKKAHVIPQGFGNRYLISLEQCDDCNQKCGLIEEDLMNMLVVFTKYLPVFLVPA